MTKPGMIYYDNAAAAPYEGWIRCTTDYPISSRGVAIDDYGDEVRWVRGHEVALGVHAIDLHVNLGEWDKRSFDLSTSDSADETEQPPALPPADVFGQLGLPMVGPAQLSVVSIEPDGAGFACYFRGRVNHMLVAHLWLMWYPDYPSRAGGELVISVSNPTVPDVTVQVPRLTLWFNNARVQVHGLHEGQELLPVGETLADGQCRAWPVAVFWPALVKRESEKHSWHQAASQFRELRAYGLSCAWPTGDAYAFPGAAKWGEEKLGVAALALNGWETGGLGPNAYSRDTGKQEDQCWVGGECVDMPAGLAAGQMRYLAALGGMRRPCHHCEVDGRPIDLNSHPNLVLWDSRPHSSGTDRLGKSRELTQTDTHRWWGFDTQHWLVGTLCLAARATDSPALQWELQHQARCLIKTSREYVQQLRAVGWMSLAFARVYEALSDRAMAARLRDEWKHWVDRQINGPNGYAACWQWWWYRERDAIDMRATSRDPTCPAWMHGIAAYGLDYAAEVFEQEHIRKFAAIGARGAVENLWSEEGGRMVPWYLIGVTGEHPNYTVGPLVPGAGAARAQALAAWMILDVAVVLRHQPGHLLARKIWDQYMADGPCQSGKWLPPELL